MAKSKATRKKPTRDQTLEETAKRAEVDRVRRLTGLHRSLIARTAALRRASKRADIVRVETARVLLEGTDYGVFGNEQWDSVAKHRDELDDQVSKLRHELSNERAAVAELQGRLEVQRDALEELRAGRVVGSGR